MKKFILSAVAMLSIAMMSATSHADMAPGLFRLHLSSTFLEVGTGETSIDDQPDDQYGGLKFGLGVNHHGLGFGFSLGEGIIIGGRVTLGQDSSDWTPGNDGDAFVVSILPYFEYVFMTTRIRPFVKAQLGIQGAHFDSDDGFWGLLIGGGGGLHFFLRESVSIDLDMDLGFRFGTGHWENGGGPDIEYNHWRFSFATLVGLSAWI